MDFLFVGRGPKSCSTRGESLPAREGGAGGTSARCLTPGLSFPPLRRINGTETSSVSSVIYDKERLHFVLSEVCLFFFFSSPKLHSRD